MDVAKKYHGMIEKTIYVLEEVVIIAENEIEAEDKLLDRDRSEERFSRNAETVQ